MKLKQLVRLIQINHVLAKYRLDDIIQATHLLRPFHFFSFFLPYRWRNKFNIPRGERLRLALQVL